MHGVQKSTTYTLCLPAAHVRLMDIGSVKSEILLQLRRGSTRLEVDNHQSL